MMDDTNAELDHPRGGNSLLPVMALVAGLGSFVTGLIKAKGSADRLDHADVIVSSTTVLLLAVRWRRDREK